MAVNVFSNLIQTLNLSVNNLNVIRVKSEPTSTSSYGIISASTLTDLDANAMQRSEDVTDEAKDGGVAVESPPMVTEVKPRRTARKSMNKLISKFLESNLTEENTKIDALERFNLNEISSMGEQQLIQNFAEMSRNDMTKYFSYTCCFSPEVCSNFFTSFGTETEAKNRMQKHITQHVKNLLAEQSDKSVIFDVRNRPSNEGTKARKRGRPSKSISVANNNKNNKGLFDTSTTSNSDDILNMQELESRLEIIELSDIKKEKDADEEIFPPPTNNPVSALPSQTNKNGLLKSVLLVKNIRKKKIRYDDDTDWQLQTKPSKRMKVTDQNNSGNSWVSSKKISDDLEESVAGRQESQACNDHNFDIRHYNPSRTTNRDDELDYEIHKRPLPSFELQSIDDKVKAPRSHLPLDLKNLPNDPFKKREGINLQRPKIRIYKKLIRKNRSSDSSERESRKSSQASSIAPRLATEDEIIEIEKHKGHWTEEQVQILATYYLKEHEKNKGKKRKNVNGWRCKICPDKKFTAPTTLTYHYKSHSGNKSFFCEICNHTFTRQHSLDYHKMTHFDTNRFKCEVCGKEFRHTSHFKNHLALHTGKEISNCEICHATFKSRTTYNRHMKNKHNFKPPSSNKASRVMSLDMINKIHRGVSTGTPSDVQENKTEDLSNSAETSDPTLNQDIKMEVVDDGMSEAEVSDSGLGNSYQSGEELNLTVKSETASSAPLFRSSIVIKLEEHK